MSEQIPLRCLGTGERGKVSAVNASDAMHRRFLDIGLGKGTEVCCLFRAPHGDPTAYSIRGAVIAIRERDAGDVLVSPISGERS